MADSLSTLALGLATGTAFGFLLHKARVTKSAVIVGQFQLKDFTVLKTMLTAVITGGIGVYALKAAGLATLHIKPAPMAAILIGGVVFGIGMVLLGYCPGTGVAAAAEGKKDALFGLAGMLAGAAVFAECHALLAKTTLTWFDLGPTTLPQLFNTPAWVILAGLTCAALAVFTLLERLKRPA